VFGRVVDEGNSSIVNTSIANLTQSITSSLALNMEPRHQHTGHHCETKKKKKRPGTYPVGVQGRSGCRDRHDDELQTAKSAKYSKNDCKMAEAEQRV
jgi:hypothetical protein